MAAVIYGARAAGASWAFHKSVIRQRARPATRRKSARTQRERQGTRPTFAPVGEPLTENIHLHDDSESFY